MGAVLSEPEKADELSDGAFRFFLQGRIQLVGCGLRFHAANYALQPDQ
jgi:hypothetical protein